MALTIAGSDSGGGAGIQADLKVFALHGLFGASVVTAVTAQDTRRIHAVHEVPARVVAAQLACVLADLEVAAAKTGMLASAASVRAVAAALAGRRFPLVVDPVLAAKDGRRLLSPGGVRALRERLLPLASLVTPNLDEAEALLGRRVRSVPAMRAAARALVELGAGAALVKGGHLEGAPVDVLDDGRRTVEWHHPRIRTPHTHGTGCVLSAAVTARLARGGGLLEAVAGAVEDVSSVLRQARPLGSGRGPADPLLAGPGRWLGAGGEGRGGRPGARRRAP